MVIELREIWPNYQLRSIWNPHRDQSFLWVCSGVFLHTSCRLQQSFWSVMTSLDRIRLVLPSSWTLRYPGESRESSPAYLTEMFWALWASGKFVCVWPILSERWRCIFSVVRPSFEDHTAQFCQFHTFCSLLYILFWSDGQVRLWANHADFGFWDKLLFCLLGIWSAESVCNVKVLSWFVGHSQVVIL